MKSVKKRSCIICFIVIWFAFGCQKAAKFEHWDNSNFSYINYDKDVLISKVNVFGDERRETFIITRYLYVRDSCFGFLTETNSQNAYNYKGKEPNDSPYLKYVIEFRDKDKTDKLWEINYPNDDNISFPVLEQGICSKVNNSEVYLKVLTKSSYSSDFKCLNFRFNSANSWTLISKEKLTTEKVSGLVEYNGYCLDTVTKHVNRLSSNKTYIDLNYAFDNLSCRWQCY